MYLNRFKSYRKNLNFPRQSDWLSVLSLSVLLYLMGMLCFFLLYGKNLLSHNKEQIPFIVTLKDSSKENEIFNLQQKLKNNELIRSGSVIFVSKEEALNKLSDKNLTKEDLMIFGENLLPNSIEFKLKSTQSDKLNNFLSQLRKNECIDEISYSDAIVESYSYKLIMIGLIVGLFILFFIFVADNIVRNSINFSLKDNENTIKLLELSGACYEHIKKPYQIYYLTKGFAAGLIAIAAILLTFYFLQHHINDLFFFIGIYNLAIILISLLLFSIFINNYSSYKIFRTIK
jgi:cell division transport system permease protein